MVLTHRHKNLTDSPLKEKRKKKTTNHYRPKCSSFLNILYAHTGKRHLWPNSCFFSFMNKALV